MPKTPTTDYYALLRVSPTASAAEIKAAFRRLSFETHPDHNPHPDANRRMAELIAARDTLLDPLRRAEYDRERGRTGGTPKRPMTFGEQRREEARRPRPRPNFRKPAERGLGSLQPERFPDWYEFLGLRSDAPTADILTALRRMNMHLNAANYSPEDEALLRRQVREAAETLTTPRHRQVYDRARDGIPPPPGQYAHLHPNWYTFLGVSPRADRARIAEQVTALSAALKRDSREYHEITEAWKVLQDDVRRAEYDAALREGAGQWA